MQPSSQVTSSGNFHTSLATFDRRTAVESRASLPREGSTRKWTKGYRLNRGISRQTRTFFAKKLRGEDTKVGNSCPHVDGEKKYVLNNKLEL
jgi:hypothetical protein